MVNSRTPRTARRSVHHTQDGMACPRPRKSDTPLVPDRPGDGEAAQQHTPGKVQLRPFLGRAQSTRSMEGRGPQAVLQAIPRDRCAGGISSRQLTWQDSLGSDHTDSQKPPDRPDCDARVTGEDEAPSPGIRVIYK